MSLPKKIWIPVAIIAVFGLLVIFGPVVKKMNETVESQIAEKELKKDITSEDPQSDVGKQLQSFQAAAKEIAKTREMEKSKLELASISSIEDLKNVDLVTKVAANLRSGHEIDGKYFDALLMLFSQQEEKLQASKTTKQQFEEGFFEGALSSIADQKEKLNLLKTAESDSFISHRQFFKWVLEHQPDISVEGGIVKLKTTALQKEYDEIAKDTLSSEEAYAQLQEKLAK